jgi:mRNA-degrading endonuclease RelE of RelBE toxin-antitoxin system
VTYRIQFAPPADGALRVMDKGRRSRFESEMKETLGRDPYGHGSTQIGRERDRREATVASVIVVYYVSQAVMVVTAVKLVY